MEDPVAKVSNRVKKRANWWQLGLIAFAVLAVRIPSFFLPMNRDSGTFAYGGWRILCGELPYRHFWDNKLPGIFYLDALALKLFGLSTAGLVIFQLLYGIAAAFVFYAVARRFASSRSAFIASLLFAFYSGCYGLNEEGNFTESYIALPVLLGVLMILNWDRRRDRFLLPFIAGALGATAALIKQPAAAVVPAMMIFAIVSERRRSGYMAAGAVIAGACAVMAVVVAWMVHEGLWGAAIDANLGFNRLYVVDAYTEGWTASKWNLFRGLVMIALPFTGALAGIFSKDLRKLPAVWLLVPWFVLDLVGLGLGGRFYTHYFLAILPSSLILSAVLLDSIQPSRRAVLTAIALGTFLFLGPVWSIRGDSIDRRTFPVSSIAERQYYALRWIVVRRLGQEIKLPAEEIAQWIELNSDTSDTIYVWGYDPRIGFLAQRAFPTRYIHIHPLAADGFGRQARIKELARDIEEHLPRYIIDQSSLPQMMASTPPLGQPASLTSTRRLFRLDGYEPVKKVVARNYEPVAMVGGCVVYEMKEGKHH